MPHVESHERNLSTRVTRRRFGHECARIRQQRNLTRVQVGYALQTYLSEQRVLGDPIGEIYIGRVENGQVVKLPREIVEGLCVALHCTPPERARLMLCADFNVLGEYADDTIAELINYFSACLFTEMRVILQGLNGQRRARDMSEAELRELMFAALDLIRRHTT